MLKPAILYKDELLREFGERIYDTDYYYYSGYRYSFTLPDLEIKDNHIRYAVISPDGRVIGYFAYYMDDPNDTACNFGLFSFEKGNPLVVRDVFAEMERLIENGIRRIEFRCVGGNPVKRHYDAFVAKHKGNCVTLHSVTKNKRGAYVDEYIYEILNGG